MRSFLNGAVTVVEYKKNILIQTMYYLQSNIYMQILLLNFNLYKTNIH